jgi:hypothetical protein
MALALNTLITDYRRKGAPLPNNAAFSAPLRPGLRVPADHDCFGDQPQIAAEMAGDVASVRNQVDEYLNLLISRSGWTGADSDVLKDRAAQISDLFGDILGELQNAAEG